MLSIDAMKTDILPLMRKYDVDWMDLFGSYATGCASETSDVDFLVKFRSPVPSIFAVMGLKEELSRSLRIPVDLVTSPIPRPSRLNVGKTIRIYES
jgi:uncharacterized protein